MVWHVDNKTGVQVRPKKDPVYSAVALHFSDQLGQTPTIPQADWFNMIQSEMLSIADALGVTPDKLDDNQLGIALKEVLKKIDDIKVPKVLDSLGTSKTDAASQNIVNEVNKKVEEKRDKTDNFFKDSLHIYLDEINRYSNYAKIGISSEQYGRHLLIQQFDENGKWLGNHFIDKNESGTSATREWVINLFGVPVDQVFYFESSSPPAGYIARNGQIINQALMPKLYARFGAKMPDDRDRVHRMTGSFAGSVGVTQEDAIRNIYGSVDSSGLFAPGTPTVGGGFYVGNSTNTSVMTNVTASYHGLNFDASRIVPVAQENRVKSRAMLFCHKIQ